MERDEDRLLCGRLELQEEPFSPPPGQGGIVGGVVRQKPRQPIFDPWAHGQFVEHRPCSLVLGRAPPAHLRAGALLQPLVVIHDRDAVVFVRRRLLRGRRGRARVASGAKQSSDQEEAIDGMHALGGQGQRKSCGANSLRYSRQLIQVWPPEVSWKTGSNPCFLKRATVVRVVSIRKSSLPVANQKSLRPFLSLALSNSARCRSSHVGPAGALVAPPRPPPKIGNNPELKTPTYPNCPRWGTAMFNVWLPPMERPAMARRFASA